MRVVTLKPSTNVTCGITAIDLTRHGEVVWIYREAIMLMDILWAITVGISVFFGYALMLFFRDALPVILSNEETPSKKEVLK